MNDYSIKVFHPEWGEQASLVGQGNSALEALERAVGNGTNGSYGAVMIAVVRNMTTGFCTRIEFTHGG